MRSYGETDAAAVHGLLVAAFAENAEEVLPFARWHPWMTQDPGFDPGVWFLAAAGAELVGACLCWREGWVKDLAVRPSWRGRGLGEALMRRRSPSSTVAGPRRSGSRWTPTIPPARCACTSGWA